MTTIHKLFCTFGCAAMFALAAAAPAHAEKRVALVVGNATYQHVPRLANPANDARLMAETLRALGFYLVGNGPQLDLDEAGLRRAVQSFGSALPGAEVALFYYAGHGVQVRGGNYLVPVGANPTKEADVDFQMLDTNLVLRQMESAGARLNLVILDACRNNPFGGRGLRTTAPGLAQMQAPQGTLISFATQPGNVALDGTGGNSPYTRALAEAIRKPGLDIFRAFNEVGLAVASATGGTQQPWVSLSPIKGEFYFAGPGAGAQPAAQPVVSPAAQAWAVTQNTTSVAVLEDFIRQFGDTVYGSLARARLNELKRTTVATVTPPQAQPLSPPHALPERQQLTPDLPKTQGDTQIPLIYSPWTKVCTRGSGANARQTCFTGKDARTEESGALGAAVVLIEPAGDVKNLLRVTVPLGMQLKHGTRLIIDKAQPLTASYFACLPNIGCMSEYEVDVALIRKLKEGQTIVAQMIDLAGRPHSMPLPLADFAKAYDGPPSDPKIVEAYQNQLMDGLERRAAAQGRSLDRSGTSVGALSAQNLAPTQVQSVVSDGPINLTYFRWTKFCARDGAANAKQACFTVKDGRIESGIAVVAAVLIEPEGETKKYFRVTVPLGMQLKHGLRLVFDKAQPLAAPYVTCLANRGCMAEYEANADMIDRLKRGTQATVQVIDMQGKRISLTLPIGSEFAKAHAAPPTDQKVVETQMKIFQEEMERRAAARR